MQLVESIPTEALADYKNKHYIPKNIDLSISNFEEFLNEREEMIIQKLESELL